MIGISSIYNSHHNNNNKNIKLAANSILITKELLISCKYDLGYLVQYVIDTRNNALINRHFVEK